MTWDLINTDKSMMSETELRKKLRYKRIENTKQSLKR